MNIITLSPRGFGANTYIITTDNQTAIVVDPAQARVEGELIKRGLTATHVLLTHCHFDHVGGVPALQAGGAKVYLSEEEAKLVGTQADLFDLFGAPRAFYQIDGTFSDGEKKQFGDLSVTALLTAGHTAGSCCYLIEGEGERALFTGDTLFMDSIGRTDFPTGDIGEMRKSLRKLRALEGDIPLFAGHNDPTTLERERKYNPFLQDV